MVCKFGCEDSIVYKSETDNSWNCLNCGGSWFDDDVDEEGCNEKTVDNTWTSVPNGDNVLVVGAIDNCFTE